MSKTQEELRKEIKELKHEAKKFFNYEQALKLILNSIYGAFGNEYFYFFDVDIAESITLQGQDAILYTEDKVNKYFTDFWHKDDPVHRMLACYINEFENMKTLDENIQGYKDLNLEERASLLALVEANYKTTEPLEVRGKVLNPIGIYIDTDSVYMSFQEVLDTIQWPYSGKDFILVFYRMRLKGYIERVLNSYANNLNAENFLHFELESIAKSAIWMAKKKYIQEIVWNDPDIHFGDLEKIKSKGFEIVQASTPTFARKKLNEILTYIFSVEEVQISNLVKLLKKVKNEFKVANVEHLTINFRINNYSKHIKDDYKAFEIEKGCPMHVRAAGHHNYLLNNSEHKGKYELLGNGERVKMYFAKDESCNVFAFGGGQFPYEFAPPIDYDAQFERTILGPINRILSAMDLQTLDRNLIYSAAIF